MRYGHYFLSPTDVVINYFGYWRCRDI